MSVNIAVIGAGSWGTTLAILLANKQYDVSLWVYEPEQLKLMQKQRVNHQYLPGIALPENIALTGDINTTVGSATHLVLAVPTHAMREVCTNIADKVNPEQWIINVSKGIENDTLKRMSEVIAEILPVKNSQITTLYGPSHAEEVSKGIATAVVAASIDLQTARMVRDLFMTEYFRVYSSDDIIGVELGGSLKNVIAIAAGIADGAGFGDNTKAALLTRGLVEITRLAMTMGARQETFAGLSGMGDLIVTCMSKHSRNRHVGEQIGRGHTLDQVLGDMVMVAEGVKTTRSVHQLSEKLQVEMPISEQVYQVLFHN
ncbi:MAG: NAD(P)H-dependent glycerol-3-phosphate dehydrogenase, partial [Aliifodinibius sp.]|nr:NAD(P)H-dependent glycerol-3-phosphate dehydrogenase [Fodinibius sp.]NIV12590.1 NAD(P)H-dependent glycerol-3-phosphate dehydrogenase [Fodinibius sp.]NIY26295.1 NAD(P)H-dependent glycerol-3-phosphate dehydrogenase [Fodinibius sp.]